MAAGKYNFTIEQGTSWIKHLALTTNNDEILPLHGYVFRGQIREDYDSPDVVASFVFSNLIPDSGTVIVSLPAEVTAAIPAGATYVYDMELVRPNGEVVRLIQGKIKVSPEVTK